MKLAKRDVSASAAAGRGVTAPDEGSFVREYLELVDEGGAPDLDHYLRRVPEGLRERVFRAVDAALANRGAEDVHLLPEVELVAAAESGEVAPAGRRVLALTAADRRLTCLALLFPRRLRHEYMAEMLASRADLRLQGRPRILVALKTAWDVLAGVAQHAPLMPLPDVDQDDGDPLAAAGRIAWRLCGPALFVGCLAGSIALLTAGGGLLAVALGILVALASRGIDDENRSHVALVNTVLSGGVVVMAVATFLGGVAAVVMAMAVALQDARTASAAATGLLLGVVGALAAVTLQRGTPEPWHPRRLVRIAGP
jgi:hypothetical protein